MAIISILNLSPNSLVFMLAPNALKLYMHLLASATIEKTLIIAKHTEDKIPYAYKKHLPELVSSKVIHVSKEGTIYLGEDAKLFANETNVLAAMQEELERLFKEYSARRRKNIDVIEAWSRASRLINLIENIKRGYDLLTLYKGVYCLVNQNLPSRDFTGKEVGQFNSILRMYGAEKSVQLICYYLLNYTEDTGTPTINQLISQKDTLFSEMRKGSKHETRADIILDDSDDF